MKRPILIPSAERIRLQDFDPGYTGKYKDKEQAKLELEKNLARMAELQEVLYAEGKHALLIVLQAMDAGGKDGTIRNVMSGLNPQGCCVTSFKAPTPEELAHDFLWRIHRRAPAEGYIGVFNQLLQQTQAYNLNGDWIAQVGNGLYYFSFTRHSTAFPSLNTTRFTPTVRNGNESLPPW